MAKKIKHRTKSREEREKEREEAAEERARQAAGIQDDFQARGFELVEWIHENQKYVLGFIGLVVLIGAGLGVYSLSTRSTNLSASKELSAAVEVVEAEVGPELPGLTQEGALRFETAKEKSDKALEKLSAVWTSHPGTGAATLARLYAGNAALDAGDDDAAIQHYGEFLSATPKTDPLYFAGLNGRAAAYESKGQNDSALADYQALADLGDAPSRDAALVSLARLHLKAGNKDKAKAALDRFNRDFPDSALKPAADDLLAQAGGAAPAVDTNG